MKTQCLLRRQRKSCAALSIKTTLSALQHVTKNVIVISGEMGVRGESYHTKDHQRILPDMFGGFPFPERGQVTAHIEQIVQAFGRLNTIETFTMHGQACPTIRLWANKGVHILHQQMLWATEDRKKKFQITPCYETGLKEQANMIISTDKNGKCAVIMVNVQFPNWDDSRNFEAR